MERVKHQMSLGCGLVAACSVQMGAEREQHISWAPPSSHIGKALTQGACLSLDLSDWLHPTLHYTRYLVGPISTTRRPGCHDPRE
mmetsp:Transcript_63624/g.112755  ORF Transcript_63624/g.112755 Transcript_63624/m.112755 type:complete len:85 (+) Transcript_63624:501-755(+)